MVFFDITTSIMAVSNSRVNDGPDPYKILVCGVARSKIVFSSLQGDSKEIYVMDYDGADQRVI